MQLKGTQIKEKPTDLTGWVYDNIKQLILDNTLPADTQINIDDMSKELQVSRTPVREALLQLKDKGLVRIVPHVGCFVSSITQEEFHEVFELRGIIECYAAARAAVHMPDEEIKQWIQAVDRSEEALARGDVEEFNRMEIVLHDYLIESLNNKRIQSVMESVADSIYRERKIAMGSEENVAQSAREHRVIAMAIAKRDPVEAEQAMRAHIRNVEYRIERVAFGK